SNLAETQRYLGHLLEQTQRVPEAETVYRQALALFEKLAAESPSDRHSWFNLVALHKKLGELLRASDQEQQAEQAYRQAMPIQEKLIVDFPDVPEYQTDLAGTLRDLATLAHRRHELPAASQWLRGAIEHQQAALKLRPDNTAFRQALCQSWGNLTSILVQLGEHGAAAEAADEFSRLFPESADNHYVATCFLARCARLAEQDSQLTPDKRRAAAQTYADQAMNQLRKAIQRGFKDAEQLSQNADLDSLRSRADFKR